jgi:ABC-2 type transport system ATP-binding protein
MGAGRGKEACRQVFTGWCSPLSKAVVFCLFTWDICKMLHLVGLSGKADRPVKSFSGCERQRLGIAQAQVNYPDLLILDEPAAALDPIGRHDVLVIMEKLRKYATVFYSTHILDDVQQVSDTV